MRYLLAAFLVGGLAYHAQGSIQIDSIDIGYSTWGGGSNSTASAGYWQAGETYANEMEGNTSVSMTTDIQPLLFSMAGESWIDAPLGSEISTTEQVDMWVKIAINATHKYTVDFTGFVSGYTEHDHFKTSFVFMGPSLNYAFPFGGTVDGSGVIEPGQYTLSILMSANVHSGFDGGYAGLYLGEPLTIEFKSIVPEASTIATWSVLAVMGSTLPLTGRIRARRLRQSS